MDKILPIIKKSFLFNDIADDEIVDLLARDGVSLVNVSAGEDVQNGNTHALFVVIDGEANVLKTHEEGNTMFVSVLGSAEILGAASLFSDEHETATKVVAKRKMLLLRIKENTFKLMLKQNAKLFDNYMRYLTERLRFLVGRMELLGVGSASSKLLSYIVENATDNAVTLKRSYSSLATTLGISRATLYRAFDELEAQGKITRKGKTINLTDISHE
ncbi:MAG: Crp/Fnr family transcriptional regulator [Clostridiales bacterium]|nr:Crp/Fnr family transcriptional regulator [Clostridiales bacterium]